MSDCDNHFVSYSDDIPSQFFRKNVAKIKGIDEKWNWVVFPLKENIIKTIQDIGEI